ncbi:MAG: class I SAM-dependent methyltransferase [Roseiflexaceae bacterium]
MAWLQTAEALALLNHIDPNQHLSSMSFLRKHIDASHAAALFELAWVRQRATTKFTDGHRLWFTREALEQASHERVAQARLVHVAAATHIADICCGCGGDALTLATVAPTIALDTDTTRIALAKANLAQRNLHATCIVADATTYAVPDSVDVVFFDPGRRQHGKRIFDADDYIPPLSLANQWRHPSRRIIIKCAPGIDYAQLPFAQPYAIDCVSLYGDMRETLVMLDMPYRWQRQATVIRSDGIHRLTNQPDITAMPITTPQRYIYEPDTAVIRAGLVTHFAAQHDLFMIDPQIAYVTGAIVVDTPFARCWQVLDTLPFNERQLRQRLRQLHGGSITVKKRGSPIDTDALAKRLSQPDGVPYVVILTRVAGQHTALICQGPIQTQEHEHDAATK